MQKCTKAEIKLAMKSNNISVETLRNYIIEQTKEAISTSYVYHLINGIRQSEKIENIIWGLLGSWIEHNREHSAPVIKLPDYLYDPTTTHKS